MRADDTTLASLLTFTRDGEWGKGEPTTGHSPAQVIRGTDFERVRRGDLSTLPLRYIRSDVLERKEILSGDTLIETAGGTKDQPTGRSVLIPQSIIDKAEYPLVCASFARFLRPNPDEVIPEFLFWKLQDEYHSRRMMPYHIQHTGVARFQYTQFATTYDLPLPPKDTQTKVATLLGTLDDKIEMNRRMNETLEAMAREVFKDWFVDFGPTRRKAEGETDPAAILGGLLPDPAKATLIAALFPDRFGENGLPEGWNMGQLSDWSKEAGETVKPSEIDPETPYFGLEHLPRRSIALDQWETAEKVTSNKSRFKQGQTLFGKLRPYFHKTGITAFDGICSTDIVVIDALEKRFRPFVTTSVSTDAFVAFTDQTSTGTKMPRTKWSTMRNFDLVSAGPEVVEAFSELFGGHFELIVANIQENLTLAATRDLLLPKLMCGEIRLKDAEGAV